MKPVNLETELTAIEKTPLEILAEQILEERGKADRTETYDDHLKCMEIYKQLRAKWESVAGKAIISIVVDPALEKWKLMMRAQKDYTAKNFSEARP